MCLVPSQENINTNSHNWASPVPKIWKILRSYWSAAAVNLLILFFGVCVCDSLPNKNDSLCKKNNSLNVFPSYFFVSTNCGTSMQSLYLHVSPHSVMRCTAATITTEDRVFLSFRHFFHTIVFQFHLSCTAHSPARVVCFPPRGWGSEVLRVYIWMQLRILFNHICAKMTGQAQIFLGRSMGVWETILPTADILCFRIPAMPKRTMASELA